MNLSQMEYIIALARVLNFSEAAQVLHITQSALSKQIALIEDEIGIKLFNRNNKNTSLTAAGAHFCQGIEKILQEYTEVIDSSRQIERSQSGRLRIGITEFRAIQHNALSAIQAIKSQGYQVDVISRNLLELNKALIQGDVDIVIQPVQKNLAAPQEHNSMFLYEVRNCLVIPTSVFDDSSQEIKLEDFVDSDFLMVGKQMPAFEESVRESFKRINYIPRFKYVETFSDLVVMIASNLGVSILPEEHYLAKDYNLTFLRLPEIESSEVHAVWKKNSTNPIINLFVQQIKEMNK